MMQKKSYIDFIWRKETNKYKFVRPWLLKDIQWYKFKVERAIYGRNISNEWDYLIQIKIRGDQKICGVTFRKNRVFIH